MEDVEALGERGDYSVPWVYEMTPREAAAWIDSPWRDGEAEERKRRAMQVFLTTRLAVALDDYFYWPPHCGFSVHIFLDDANRPAKRQKDDPTATQQVTIYVSSRAPIATFRIRRLDESPWWESDRRWTLNHTSEVFGFARGNARAVCDTFGLRLMLPDQTMDDPLPGRFRKLDPQVPATIFSEMFSEM